MTWLHLTIVSNYGSSTYYEEPIYVNSNHIVYLKGIKDQPQNPAKTYIQTVNIMPDDCWFNVKETPHEILSQIPCP